MIEAARALFPPSETAAGRAGQRARAAELLLLAYDRYGRPRDPRVLEEAARQLLLAAATAEDERRAEQLLERAIEVARRAVETHGRPHSLGLARDAYWTRARETGASGDWDAAVDYARRLADADPHAIAPWSGLGDVLWDAGRRTEAADAYRRALESDRNLELDPLEQLGDAERATLEARIAEAGG